MIRILIFLLSIVLIAGTITYFASMDGRIQAEAFGLKFDGPSGLIAGGFFALIAIVIYLTSLFKNLARLPGSIKAREAEARREKGIVALTRGLEAVAVGDASDATHHARIARRHLDEMSLTRLLTAQAAQMSGDDVAARENFAAMLEAPETEFLGLRGLYLQAIARDDKDAARLHAERAFALRSNAKWAFESVLDLALERGAWGDAREALAKARKNSLMPPEKIDRADAVLFTADASAALLAGDHKTALSEAEAALKLAPGFTPAAVLAARLHDEQGRSGKAAKIIENAFAAAPHPALAKQFEKLSSADKPEKRAEALARLAGKAADSREAKLLLARRDILLENWAEAIARTEPMLTDAPTAEEFFVMAAAMKGEHGEDVGRGWIERAAAAPRDPRPGADGEFHFTNEGWAKLVREYMDHGRLSPPPLEAAHFRMSHEDLRLLTAPLAAVEEPAGLVAEPVVEDKTAYDALKQGGDARDSKEPETQDDGIANSDDADRAAAAAREVS